MLKHVKKELYRYPLALIRLSTEFSHHICIGPSPKKKYKILFSKYFRVAPNGRSHSHIVWNFWEIVELWQPVLTVVEVG